MLQAERGHQYCVPSKDSAFISSFTEDKALLLSRVGNTLMMHKPMVLSL